MSIISIWDNKMAGGRPVGYLQVLYGEELRSNKKHLQLVVRVVLKGAVSQNLAKFSF